jgi:photosystem II stability/assembly factor-like uncharacterized protein
MRTLLVLVLSAAAIAQESAPAPEGAPFRQDLALRIPWRNLGPSNMGGRITDIDVHPDQPFTWYVATAGGGLLKTTNCGTTWEKLFQDQPVASIGDVAVAPSNPDIVWIGSGEENARNSVQWGDGVYKSTDAGKTWQHMGLHESFQIGHVAIHPKDPDIVFVAALGRLWGDNPERGVYRTQDGGKSWARVLYLDDKTGCIDVRIDPRRPETVYAVMYERKRDLFCSNDPAVRFGEQSGIFRSDNGGESWKKLTAGLPTCKWGRAGLALHGTKSNVVYAILETEKSGWASGGEARSATAEQAAQAAQRREMDPEQLARILGFFGIDGKDAPGGGALLVTVGEESPASQAGFKANDVIRQIGETKVASWNDLTGAFLANRGGDAVKVALRRGAEDQTLEVTFAGGGPGGQGGQGFGGQGRGNRATLGAQGEDGEGGAKVTQLTADGPAAKAGVQEGDLIVQVGERKVATFGDLTEAVNAARVGEKSKLTVKRGDVQQELEVTWAARTGGGPGATGGGGNSPSFGGRLGGQAANIQEHQGPNGFETGGVFRSDDRGETWTRINSLTERPFYYSVLVVDPSDDNYLWSVGVSLWRSTDAGKTFRAVRSGIHPDFHAVWVNPKDGRHVVTGSDGGVCVSWDRGETFEHLNNFTAGQYYHCAVDNAVPYHVFGGLQDNGTWRVPSRTRFTEGITLADCFSFYGGDGFGAAVDPEDDNVVYATSQNGAVGRVHMDTGAQGRVQRPRGEYSFNWDTPFFLSPHNPRIYYFAGSHAFRSLHRGDKTEAISGRLGLTQRGTATAFAESPLRPGAFYVGTDDGALWRSKDGGKTWDDIQKNVKLPGPRYCSTLHPSPYREGRVYASFDGHRSDDDLPHVYVSEDFGDTWTSLRSNLPDGPVHVCRDVPPHPAWGRNENLLFLGTEFGAWVSFDRGQYWWKLGSGLPTVAVRDLAIQNRDSDLVAATHGQSIWALDIAPLRQLSDEIVKKPAHLFVPEALVQWQMKSRGLSGHKDWKGTNPPAGTPIYLYLASRPERDPVVTIHDVTGRQVSSVTGKVQPGIQLLQWDGRLAAQGGPPGGGEGAARGARGGRPGGFGGIGRGTQAPPGAYSARYQHGDETLVQMFTVESDPIAQSSTSTPSRN